MDEYKQTKIQRGDTLIIECDSILTLKEINDFKEKMENQLDGLSCVILAPPFKLAGLVAAEKFIISDEELDYLIENKNLTISLESRLSHLEIERFKARLEAVLEVKGLTAIVSQSRTRDVWVLLIRVRKG